MNRFYERFANIGKGIEAVARSYNEAAATGRTLSSSRRKFAELAGEDRATIITPEEVSTTISLTSKSPDELRELSRESAPLA